MSKNLESKMGYEKIGNWDISLDIPKRARDIIRKGMIDYKEYEEGNMNRLCYVEHRLSISTAKMGIDPWLAKEGNVRNKVAQGIEEWIKGNGHEYALFYGFQKIPPAIKDGLIIFNESIGPEQGEVILIFNYRTGQSSIEAPLTIKRKPTEEQIKMARLISYFDEEKIKGKKLVERSAYDWISLGETAPDTEMLRYPLSDLNSLILKMDMKDTSRNRTSEKKIRKLYDTWMNLARDSIGSDEQIVKYLESWPFPSLKYALMPYIKERKG